jgi:hypothetical protein
VKTRCTRDGKTETEYKNVQQDAKIQYHDPLVAVFVPWWCYESFVFGCSAGLLVCGPKH